MAYDEDMTVKSGKSRQLDIYQKIAEYNKEHAQAPTEQNKKKINLWGNYNVAYSPTTSIFSNNNSVNDADGAAGA